MEKEIEESLSDPAHEKSIKGRERMMRLMQKSIYLIAAVLTGLIAVLIGHIFELFEQIANHFFTQTPITFAILSPALFILSSLLVSRFAKFASGSGIPQVIAAVENLDNPRKPRFEQWIAVNNLRTAAVKIISTCVALVAGASVGREGPTAQIGAAVFQAWRVPFRRWLPCLDVRSLLVAGAASGIAASFNAPLAGIAFALEELAPHHFRQVKNDVLLAIIVAGVTAMALVGNVVYFGKHTLLAIALDKQIGASLLVGVVCGIASAAFCRATILARDLIEGMNSRSREFLVPALAGVIVVACLFLSRGDTLGAGRALALRVLDGDNPPDLLTLTTKFIATLVSFSSGIAGGIFAPSLSLGATLGGLVGNITSVAAGPFCGILGMTAFLAGVTQAPLTSIIIVTEMTDKHDSILAIMCTAFIGYFVGRLLQQAPLYHQLAKRVTEKL